MRKKGIIFLLSIGIMMSVHQQTLAQWVKTSLGSGITALAVYDTNLFAGSYTGGIFLSKNLGTSWTTMNTGLTDMDVNALIVSENNLFASTICSIYHDTVNDTNWTKVDSTYCRADRALIMNGPYLFGGTGSGVIRSNDSGKSWSLLDSGLTNVDVRSLSVIGSILLAGTWDGVFLSYNNGDSWVSVGLQGYCVLTFLVNGSNIFAGTRFSGVFLSTDTCKTWVAVNDSLPVSSYVVFNCFAVNGTTIYLGTSNGVFFTSDSGKGWSNTGLSIGANAAVNSLAVCGDYLFAGVSSQYGTSGVWKLAIPSGVINKSHNLYNGNLVTIKKHSNSAISIGFSLINSARITLKIFNLTGHEIATIANKQFCAGAHIVMWNTQDVAAGCYTIKMQEGLNSFAKKIAIFR